MKNLIVLSICTLSLITSLHAQVTVSGTPALYDVSVHKMNGNEIREGLLYDVTDTSIVVMIEDYTMDPTNEERFSYENIHYRNIKAIDLQLNQPPKDKLPEILIDGKRKNFSKIQVSLKVKALKTFSGESQSSTH